MPGLEVWIPVVLAIVTPALAGIGWWFKTRLDGRIRREAAQQATVERLEAKNEALWGKVESQLMDARAYERENSVLRAERMVLDKQIATLITAMLAALERAEAAAKRREGK